MLFLIEEKSLCAANASDEVIFSSALIGWISETAVILALNFIDGGFITNLTVSCIDFFFTLI